MSFSVGSLVHARGREWVVLPDSAPERELLVLRPLGGSDDEITGIHTGLETVKAAEFSAPDPARDLGSHEDGRLLRDAVRLGFRAGAGPFRSLARIAVEPRPYQLVPLLMALRQDPIRLLIADDVGIGKTIESLLILRELLDRGEIARSAVLCPPHLAEQWQRCLKQKFNIDAALVLAGTARGLERGLGPGESLFDRHPHVVVSMDWIKSERRRHEFLRVCPELVIVDEAHTATSGEGARRSSQQRHELLMALAADPTRHLLLVTATPHSGKEDNFRSLLALLDPSLVELPEDLGGEHNRKHRETLARYLVQRRRGDLQEYLQEETPFPEREQAEETYEMSKPYRRFLDRMLEWCREQVFDEALEKRHQRIRWWSALALLRAIGSSPAAAAATLRNRAASAEADTADEADDVGRRQVLDLEDDVSEGIDVVPGSQTTEADSPEADKLRRLALEVEALAGKDDTKLQRILAIVRKLVSDGWSPILFCRFIPTVEYVATELRKALPKDVVVLAVTGDLPPDEREARVTATQEHAKRVLVCTDCLSEGINLQDGFDAVVHYDLAWNPTRHEQREGRVDRYGQIKPKVRALTFWGQDNPIDGMILNVLLRKHQSIHRRLGITVPVPMDSNTVVEAMMEALLLRRKDDSANQLLFEFAAPLRQELDVQWESSAEREKRSRSLFAQASIKVEDVAVELAATRAALGSSTDVERFVGEGMQRVGAHVVRGAPIRISFAGTSSAVRDALGHDKDVLVTFRPPIPRGAELLTRTHPIVAGLSSHVLEAALDPLRVGGSQRPARRCGVTLTRSVSERTTLLLLRLRFHIVSKRPGEAEQELLAEDASLAAFKGLPSAPVWLDDAGAEALLQATPDANIGDDVKRHHLDKLLSKLIELRPHLDALARKRGQELFDAHHRVRKAANLGLRALRVEPHLPPDVLGVFVFMPAGAP